MPLRCIQVNLWKSAEVSYRKLLSYGTDPRDCALLTRDLTRKQRFLNPIWRSTLRKRPSNLEREQKNVHHDPRT
jgi:hypothetical protein